MTAAPDTTLPEPVAEKTLNEWRDEITHPNNRLLFRRMVEKAGIDFAVDDIRSSLEKVAALAHPAALSGGDSGVVAGLCPRCAGTGRDRKSTGLQCPKCMGSGAIVVRVSPSGADTVTEAMVEAAHHALFLRSTHTPKKQAVRAALIAAIVAAPEGTGGVDG